MPVRLVPMVGMVMIVAVAMTMVVRADMILGVICPITPAGGRRWRLALVTAGSALVDHSSSLQAQLCFDFWLRKAQLMLLVSSSLSPAEGSG